MNIQTKGARAVLGVSLFTVSILLRGVVISVGWGWFIVPLGVDPIGFAHALGLSAFVATMTTQIPSNRSEKDAVEMLGEGLSVTVALFGFMWLYQLFM